MAIRALALDLALQIVEADPRACAGASAVELALEAIAWLRTKYSDEDFNSSEQRVQDQLCADMQPPKTLEALQQQPEDCLLGYEQRHIVEANPFNVAKGASEAAERMRKFGVERLDDPSNVVWAPRLKHEQITADYNASYLGRKGHPRMREVVSTMDFDAQRDIGLAELREYGVLG